jgi:hypothetical protein
MSTIAEIEAAVQKLPAAQVEELAEWLDAYRQRQMNGVSVVRWLQSARGAARTGVTTENIMAITRGEE